MVRKRQELTARQGFGRLRAWHVLLGGMLGVGSLFCSKEHEAPVAFHRTLLDTPRDLQAEFVDEERIVLTWTIADEANVKGYAVSISDSTGLLRETLVKETTHTIEESSLTAEGFVDSTWFYFQVSAMDENLFRGPASAVDSVLVY